MQRVGIIGGGPAGLAAARALRERGIAFDLFDAGPPVDARRHDRADDLGVGIGGAGLFSDGKFSFYPSGTKLYALGDGRRLRDSYHAIGGLLDRAGIDAPPFPEFNGDAVGTGDFETKDYRSSYGTLARRLDLIRDLSAGYADRIRSHATVEGLARRGDGYELAWRTDPSGALTTQGFTDVIVASGRFGPLALDALLGGELPQAEQRYEVGIRIEHPHDIGFLRHSKTPDVKFILREAEVEVRTFCTCRRGEVWLVPCAPMAALSGRSDGPPSDYCNFGLLPRFAGANRAQGRAIWEHFRAAFPDPRTAMWQTLPEFLDGPAARRGDPGLDARPWHPRERFVRGDIAGALHPALTEVLRGSIRAIVERYPDIYSPESVCLFPAVEGVGHFPDVDDDLRVPGESIWCCGDVVGRFRGLIPAMVSGHYAGSAVAAAVARARPDAAAIGARVPA